jgi:hypothetical protein
MRWTCGLRELTRHVAARLIVARALDRSELVDELTTIAGRLHTAHLERELAVPLILLQRSGA